MIELRTTTCCTLLTAFFLSGCAGDLATGVGPGRQLGDYVRQQGYQPLKIPRDRWGPGTVVSFDANGDENIVMFNDQCVRFAEPRFDTSADTPDVRVANSSLTNMSFSRDRTAGLDIALEKGVSPNVDVSAAFNDQRVHKVEVKIGTARQFVTSDLTMTEKMKVLLGANTDCAQQLIREGNYVIDDVLVVGDSSFSFSGSGNTTLKLDLALLKAINVNPALTAKYEGKSELPVTEPRIIGYKLYKLGAKLGMAGTLITATRVNPAQIAALKKGHF